MGIYTRYTTAVLTFFLSAVPLAHSATQVKTPVSTFSNIMNAAQGAVGLPYGDAAFFGQEFVAEHTAGSRFQAGQSIPGGGSSGGKVKVAIKPVVTINAPRLSSSVVGALKGGNVPVLLASAAVTWAIDQIPGAEILDGRPVRTSQPQAATGVYWEATRDGVREDGRFPDSTAACKSMTKSYPYWYYGPASGGLYPCYGTRFQSTAGTLQGYSKKVEYNCPYGVGNNYVCNTTPQPGGEPQPFTESDYYDLQDAISRVTNSDWLRDLTKAKCEGSLSPESCYQDLVDRRPNHGPSSQTGPASSTTTTKTNPDGTTSTTTTTTQHKYDYTYTQNTFNYRTSTTVTTTTDGKTTTEVIEDTSDPDNPPLDEPAQDDEDLSFDDPDMPEVEPFYEQKYPDGIAGVWEARKVEFENSAFMEFLDSFVPSFSGSCPGWSVNVNIASWAPFGVHNFQSLCWVFDFIKVVLLVSAAFLCRALIFGG